MFGIDILKTSFRNAELKVTTYGMEKNYKKPHKVCNTKYT